MPLTQWVQENREFIHDYVRRQYDTHVIDDDDAELWVSNDEFLYTSASENGVDV